MAHNDTVNVADLQPLVSLFSLFFHMQSVIILMGIHIFYPSYSKAMELAMDDDADVLTE